MSIKDKFMNLLFPYKPKEQAGAVSARELYEIAQKEMPPVPPSPYAIALHKFMNADEADNLASKSIDNTPP